MNKSPMTAAFVFAHTCACRCTRPGNQDRVINQNSDGTTMRQVGSEAYKRAEAKQAIQSLNECHC